MMRRFNQNRLWALQPLPLFVKNFRSSLYHCLSLHYDLSYITFTHQQAFGIFKVRISGQQGSANYALQQLMMHLQRAFGRYFLTL
jgi:hypothetical protein